MLNTVLKNLPLELKISVMDLVRRKLEFELHQLKMDTDVLYVLENMGRAFKEYKPFFYRGYVFVSTKMFTQPEYQDDLPYEYQVRLGICRKDEVPEGVTERTEIIQLTRETTRLMQEQWGVDMDRCQFSNLQPLLTNLMTTTPLTEEDLNWVYDFPEQKRAFELLDQCSIKTPLDVLMKIKKLIRK